VEFAVLVKVVPDLDKLRFDPDRKTMVREGVELYGNPFDLRALRVALDLQRPGEKVTVLSMGPPAAERVLTEARALGADRAILLSDRRLAGSDTLVTARVLARALSRVGHEIVFAGRWTTDSETGQVAPEVAGLLGVPILTSARAVQRDEAGGSFEVTTDTESGWSTDRAVPPFVLTTGEKIAKVRRPTSAESATVGADVVERWTLDDLGLPEASVGLAGSPTVVDRLVNEEPARSTRIFQEGSIEERVRAAVVHLEHLLDRPLPPLSPLAPLEGPLRPSEEVVILVSGANGRLDHAILPWVSEIRRSLAPGWPSGIWVGEPPSDAELLALGDAGLARLRHVSASPPVDSRPAAVGVAAVLRSRPEAVAGVFLATGFGRDVAGQVAAREQLGLTGDAVGALRGANREIYWRKPAFGGGIVANIRSKSRPSLATVRPGAVEAGQAPDSATPPVEVVESSLPPVAIERLASGEETDRTFGDLDAARVVVAAGMGLGRPERVADLAPTLERWGASLAATRRVVDAGWVPRQLQVGLTGRSLAPALVVLLGVSGAPNHLVGWKRARVALAVNSDPKAPVFRWADVGLVGRWEEILPPLTEALAPLARRLGRPRASGPPAGAPPP
jgi:electron transfer flavoprotein alpha subunit